MATGEVLPKGAENAKNDNPTTGLPGGAGDPDPVAVPGSLHASGIEGGQVNAAKTEQGGGNGVAAAELGGGGGDVVESEIKRGQKLPNRSASMRNTAPSPALMPTAKTVGNSLSDTENAPVGKTENAPVGKSEIGEQKQQVTKTDWFRYELDFRPLKSGYTVLIRKRLRWSETRYSKMIVKRTCPRLTKKMIGQISVGRFPQMVVEALQDGGIQHGFIKALQERIGKGNGRRKSELTELERSLLTRIESGISASGRSGNA